MSEAFVLDCSATLPWVFGDEATPACDALLDRLTAGARAWVPALWHLELGNVLLGAQRRGRIDQAGIEAFLTQLAVYDIAVDDRTMERAWQKTLDLALQYSLSTYDAAYLELALRRGVPLATLDSALIAAAKTCGVGLCLQGGA
ncbi:MAG: type II toxin-antitoxin system VapC family toxin [Verrucomicrobiota bacterium]